MAFLTHPILDSLNFGGVQIFHGPMSPNINAIVIAVNIIALIILFFKARRYWVGMLFADLPDLEWAVFSITGWDKTTGLHYNYFYPDFLSTEWGLLVQLALFILLALIIILPSKGPVPEPKPAESRRFGWSKTRIPVSRQSFPPLRRPHLRRHRDTVLPS